MFMRSLGPEISSLHLPHVVTIQDTSSVRQNYGGADATASSGDFKCLTVRLEKCGENER